MRDPFGLNERLFAFYYPHLAEMAERAGQRETRAGLAAKAQGRTLEIGAGSGLNLPHYTPAVSELVVSEPSPHMLAQLREKLTAEPPRTGDWRLVEASGEQLPFADRSFDTVLATFVLCTTPDPKGALAEIARVLKPGGEYLFLEHVRDEDGSALSRFQDLVELPHRYLTAGCHPNRRTADLIRDSPLEVEELEHGRQPRAFPTVRPTIIGNARRAAWIS